MQNKLVHAAERKAFKTVLDKFIAKSQTESAAEAANDLIGVVEKIMTPAPICPAPKPPATLFPATTCSCICTISTQAFPP